MFLSWLCLAYYLAAALAEFYIQFRLDRNKSLVRKILGNDYYDQPEWRIYLCRDFKDRGDPGNSGDQQPLAFTNDSAGICGRNSDELSGLKSNLFTTNRCHATTCNLHFAMNFFVLVAHCVLTNLFVGVFGKFYIQFRVDRPKTLIRRIIGNDYWDQPQWRIYTCSNSTSINNDSAAVHCERIKPPWPAKRLRFWSFYVERLFFKTYRPLETSSVSYKFSDITVDQLPAEIWIGSYYASNLPYLYKTKDMFDFFESKTNGWLHIIKDKSLQENLVEYLAAPDVSWAFGNPNITASYIKAYVAYMTKVILFYDSYMIEKDLKYNISDASLDWRGPTWLNWKLLKPVKKVYNRYKKGVDTMHELWLMNPESEGLLRRMIPVLTSKAMDPCFLQGVLSSFPEGSGMESYEYRGNPKDFLCTIYCRFSHVVSRLYLNSGSPAACALTGRGGRQNGGMCEKELCICNFSKRTKRKIIGTAFSTTFRYCMNVFNLRRYNETHPCSPDPT